jgi:hypothetical protein
MVVPSARRYRTTPEGTPALPPACHDSMVLSERRTPGTVHSCGVGITVRSFWKMMFCSMAASILMLPAIPVSFPLILTPPTSILYSDADHPHLKPIEADHLKQ